jgi:hypothetical protein
MPAPDHIPSATQFTDNGFEILESVVCADTVSSLRDELGRIAGDSVNQRNLLSRSPAVAAFAGSAEMADILQNMTGIKMFPVRAILFDKTPVANWHVRWHQDVAIPVQERLEVAGFGGWSVKEDVVHVHAPTEVLDTMLAVRVHLDASDSENGALCVLPGTHAYGRLDRQRIGELKTELSPVLCEVGCGGLLLMRPLLLHSSSSGSHPTRRRVIHIEYASQPLPGGLEWAIG